MKTENIKNFWFGLPKIIRYLFVGSYNFAVSFLIFAILILLLTEEYSQLCLILSYVISSFNSYFSQKFLVFETRGNYVQEYLKCSLSWGIGYVINAGLLILFQNILKINVYLSQFISLASVAILTYILFKYFSFRSKEK